MINTLKGIRANKPQQKNDGYHIHHVTNDKWRGSHTTITNAASYLMREESILIVFTRTSWRFLRAYAILLVDSTIIALFACRRLDQSSNGWANTNNNKSPPKSLIVSDYGRIRYYRNIRGLINWRRQKFSQFYLNYPYILLRSVPMLLIVLMYFWRTCWLGAKWPANSYCGSYWRSLCWHNFFVWVVSFPLSFWVG